MRTLSLFDVRGAVFEPSSPSIPPCLGPSLGGARFYPYEDEAVALDDVLRLSRAMTKKAALAGLAQGGGKAVIIGDPPA